jgi:hypothetical protein
MSAKIFFGGTMPPSTKESVGQERKSLCCEDPLIEEVEGAGDLGKFKLGSICANCGKIFLASAED